MDGDDCEQDSGLESPPHSKGESPERPPPFEERTFQPEGISLLDESGKPLILSSKNDLSKQDSVSEKTDLTISKLSFDADLEDEPDETLTERLWGLTEMFPNCVVNATHTVTTTTWSGVKNLYSFSRSVMWIVASTSVLLFAPILFELEIAKNEERQKSEQKQYLLGPSAAMIGPPGATPPMPR
ncbi:translocase of outer mitochondrial membrane 22 homolog mge [Arctopsyche grandis]|uniref:translocase of outer mitochondrial membrane 22 homolog mge n=1 Tax=Arctopsyche grandis TaxID=121162 RepID=UPI00406D6C84